MSNIILSCEICEEHFRISRKLKEKLGKEILCKRCNLSNRVFKFKKMFNINNDVIVYQSNLELKFIDLCSKYNVIVENGHIVKYKFDNKDTKYITDFYLKEYNAIVEIKDNHIWHREQVKNGKWDVKYNSVLEYCEKNNLKYYLLFPSDIHLFFENLIKI